jgi:hypothetical protein
MRIPEDVAWARAELARLRGPVDLPAKLRATLFPQQLELIFGKHQRRVACCSRRAGKTQGLIRGMLLRCLEVPKSVVCYFGHTIEAARKTVWDVPGTIPDILHELGIDRVCDIKGHSVKFKNGSVLWVAGCDTMADARLWKGFPFSFAIVDEAQDWEEEKLQYMVDVALMPSLMDRDGEIALCGVPSPRCEGLFYEVSNGIRKDWRGRGWTSFDNPHIGKVKARQFIDRVMADRALPESDPIIQREYFGRWVRDETTLLYHYQAGRNDFEELPTAPLWQHVLGMDYGSRDLTTFVVNSYREHDRTVYTSFAHGEAMAGKPSVTRTHEIILWLAAKYPNLQLVADSGALGLFITDELRHRHGISIIAAQKKEKASAIRLLNDQMRLGFKRYGPATGKLKDQLLKLQIDPRTQIEKPNQPCDFADADLYAWRHCYQYLAQPERDSSPAAQLQERVQRAIARRKENAEDRSIREERDSMRMQRELY